MPCDTIQVNSVELGKLAPSLLSAAVKREGWTLRLDGSARIAGTEVRFADGRLEGVGISASRLAELRNMVKRAYSAETIRYAARVNGWQVRTLATGQVEVLKGGF